MDSPSRSDGYRCGLALDGAEGFSVDHRDWIGATRRALLRAED